MKAKNYNSKQTKAKLILTFLTLLLFSTNFSYAQNFSVAPVFNPFGFTSNPGDGVYQPTFADLDNDGDQDLLMGRSNSNGRLLEVYENIGNATNPNFANPVVLLYAASSNPPFNNWVFLPTLGDLDGDGDFDLLVGRGDYNGLDNFEYYENTGTPNIPNFTFTATVLINDAHDPVFVDYDSDGDLDLFIGEKPNYANATVEVQYHENTGTATTPNINYLGNIPNISGNGSAFIAVGDLNLDGYKDLALTGNSSDLFFFSNDITGNFTSNGVILNSIEAFQKPALVDIDGDEDIDVFIGQETDFLFYENKAITAGTNDYATNNLISTYPNPIKNILNLNSEKEIKSIEIYDIIGKQVSKPTNFEQIDLSNLKSGIYHLKIILNSNELVVKKIIKN